MATPRSTTLRLEAHRTALSDDAGNEAVIAVGIRDIADHFRHEPPTALEMERAIDVIEDALAATGLHHAAGGELLTADPMLQALLGLGADGAPLARDDVESRFQRLASASLGQPGALAGHPSDRDSAAALLILRECMHHLGYEGIRRMMERR